MLREMYKGFEIVLSEWSNKIEIFHGGERRGDARTPREARQKVDRMAKREYKPDETKAYLRGQYGDDDFVKVEVLSTNGSTRALVKILEGEETGQEQRVDTDRLFADTPGNDTSVREVRKTRDKIEDLEGHLRREVKGMEKWTP